MTHTSCKDIKYFKHSRAVKWAQRGGGPSNSSTEVHFRYVCQCRRGHLSLPESQRRRFHQRKGILLHFCYDLDKYEDVWQGNRFRGSKALLSAELPKTKREFDESISADLSWFFYSAIKNVQHLREAGGKQAWALALFSSIFTRVRAVSARGFLLSCTFSLTLPVGI